MEAIVFVYRITSQWDAPGNQFEIGKVLIYVHGSDDLAMDIWKRDVKE